MSKCAVAAPAGKSQLFRTSAVLPPPPLRSEMQYKYATSVQGSGCWKRSTHPKCLESLRECLRGAYAEPTRRLQNKQKEGKRSKFLHTWQTVMICSTNAYALKPTRAYAPNQDCLRRVHAVPFLYKLFHLIKKTLLICGEPSHKSECCKQQLDRPPDREREAK